MIRKLGGRELTGNERFEGFTVDLIERLARDLNFKYEMYQSPGNVYGSAINNKTWSGMVGEILNGVSAGQRTIAPQSPSSSFLLIPLDALVFLSLSFCLLFLLALFLFWVGWGCFLLLYNF